MTALGVAALGIGAFLVYVAVASDDPDPRAVIESIIRTGRTGITRTPAATMPGTGERPEQNGAETPTGSPGKGSGGGGGGGGSWIAAPNTGS